MTSRPVRSVGTQRNRNARSKTNFDASSDYERVKCMRRSARGAWPSRRRGK
jgi:hypothetical protein